MGDCMEINKKTSLVPRIILLTLTAALVVFIFSNSVKDANASSASSGRVTAFINSILFALRLDLTLTDGIVRTLAHFCEFALLGVMMTLTVASFISVKYAALIRAITYSFFVAFIDECLQIFSDGRAFQFSDLMVDIAGAVSGAALVYLLIYLIYKHKIKVSEKVK